MLLALFGHPQMCWALAWTWRTSLSMVAFTVNQANGIRLPATCTPRLKVKTQDQQTVLVSGSVSFTSPTAISWYAGPGQAGNPSSEWRDLSDPQWKASDIHNVCFLLTMCICWDIRIYDTSCTCDVWTRAEYQNLNCVPLHLPFHISLGHMSWLLPLCFIQILASETAWCLLSSWLALATGCSELHKNFHAKKMLTGACMSSLFS